MRIELTPDVATLLRELDANCARSHALRSSPFGSTSKPRRHSRSARCRVSRSLRGRIDKNS